MTGRTQLEELFPSEDIEERTKQRGSLYQIQKKRAPFGDEILLIRFLRGEHDAHTLLESDVKELERIFYDEDTPNPWNTQLFWVYEQETRPPESVQSELENDTRFAIRRCVPVKLLEDFVAPLEKAQRKLENITNQFDRSELIDKIIQQGLGFLFQDISRKKKLEKLKQADERPETPISDDDPRRDPLDKFVASVELGNFRQNANLRQLDAEPFTLLYGPNASGKTSLLDGTALGLVGQIRRLDGRAHEYPGLNVTLEGESAPLDTSSEAVNNRVADWFGFRPYGRAKKHVEFYRVNYLESGEATRLAESNPDLNIEQTLRRFLFGEELTDAREDKEEVKTELQKIIKENKTEKESLESEVSQLRAKKDEAEEIFSELRATARSLSPATEYLVTEGTPKEDDGEAKPAQLKTWSEWKQRLEILEASLKELNEPKELETPSQIRQQLSDEIQHQMEIGSVIEKFKDLQEKRSQIREIHKNWNSSASDTWRAPVALVALILHENGLTSKRIDTLTNHLEKSVDTRNGLSNANSVIAWQESLFDEFNDQLDSLQERKDRIEEITNLEKRRQELREKIREKTEDYLEIVDEVHYCPACYIEQDRDAILNREKPSRPADGDDPDDLSQIKKQIAQIQQAIEVLNEVNWKQVDRAITIAYEDVCGIEDFYEFWELYQQDEIAVRLPSPATSDTIRLIAEELRRGSNLEVDTKPFERVIDEVDQTLTHDIHTLSDKVPSLESDATDIQRVEKHHQEKKETLEAGLQILDEYWPEEDWDLPVNVEGDRRVIQTTLEEIEEEPASLELSANLEEKITDTEQEIEQLDREIKRCENGIERLRDAFEGDGGEAELESFVQDHMTVISTLFIAFQRPYEFEAVTLHDDGSLVVRRRDGGDEVPPDSLSSGQRAALALAIFVTNNLAHKTAPPLMLLDEPFAHLDDVNTVSFFNLLIELATREERQIIFATANGDIADLLERKAGDSDRFKRENLPRKEAVFGS